MCLSIFVHDKQDPRKSDIIDTGVTMDSWILQVDCPTNSFIVNNIVVRNIS